MKHQAAGPARRTPQLLVVAGEASGDAHGARVIAGLRARLPDLRCFGLGGSELVDQGLERIADAGALNVVGLSEAIRALRPVLGLRKRLLAQVEQRRPQAALLIDLPGFNLHLAKHLKRRGLPVAYYIAPQAWAWRQGRVRKLRRRVDRLCVIFPFEQEFFARHGVRAEYVGHPLLERQPAPVAPDASRVAIVPGSRPREIDRLLPALAGAARLLARARPGLRFVLPLAPGLDRDRVTGLLAAAGVEAQLVGPGAMAALAGARLALVASGTATLEAALAGVPMVVTYRISNTSYALVRPWYRLQHACIVNILAKRRLVPELLQADARAERIAAAAEPLLDDGPARHTMIAGLGEVIAGLRGPRPSARVADVLVDLLAPGEA